MKVQFDNGAAMDVITVNGQNQHFMGASRDGLELQFERNRYSFEELDRLTGDPANTKRMTLLDDEGEVLGVHEHYTMRAEIAVRPIALDTPVTPDAPPVTEERLCVRLMQKTYTEQQLDTMRDTMDKLVLTELSMPGL